jgi:hypothetical protein
VLRRKSEFVDRHRSRLVKDVDKAVADAKARYEQALSETEQARQELVELRESAIWARLFPDCRESDVQIPRIIAGGERKRLAPTGLTMALEADKLFATLAADADWIPEAIPQHSQLAHDRLRGEKQADIAVWDSSPEGQAWKQDQRRQALKRIEAARSPRTRWGD